ncbi:thymidine kinase, cytosolic-like isoform X2 [Haemaphysalis longicornis]
MLVLGSCDLPVNHSSVDSQPKGQIQLIIGPMFSGKTTELMRRLKRYEIANHKCLIVKQAMAAVKATTLIDLRDMMSDFRIIGIDEGQFFPDIVEFAEDMAEAGKIVVIAALDGTYQRQGFPNILTLVPLSESVIKLSAVCMLCFAEAAYTKRRGCEKEVEVIGGADKYMAVCRACYSEDDVPSKAS